MTETDLTRRLLLTQGTTRLVGVMAAGLLPRSGASAQTNSISHRYPVNIVNTGATTTTAMQDLLKTQGFLEEFGLDANHVNVSDGSKLMGSLLSGEMDICMLAGIAQILPAIEKGAKIKLLAAANTRPSFAVYTKRPEIKSLTDLPGRNVATGAPGALLHHVMVAALQKAGVDHKTVNFVNVGSSADVFRAVIAGVVDAAPSSFEFYNEQHRWGVHTIADLWTLLPQYPFQGSFASEAAIRDKRETLVRVLAAYARLYRFMMQPDSKGAYVSAYQGVVKGEADRGEEQWAFNFRNQAYATNLVVPEANIQYQQELNVQLSTQQKVLATEAIADMSLSREAIARLG